ncbi:MAG TPA: ComEC/Rec2 family competence protein [Candidatus Limnocylindrales bacterium]
MSASGWLAIGAVLAALVTPSAGSLVTAMAAGVIALGFAGARRTAGEPAGRTVPALRALLPVALGALAIALRIFLAASPDLADPRLPEGRGPWSAVVEARGSDRDGQQVATIVISARDAMYRVAATLPRYPEIEPGSIIKVDGALEPPPDGPYGDYLHRTGVVATIRPRTLTVTGAAGGPAAALERLRRGAGDALAAAIPEPEAGLAAGIVIGLRDRVDRDLAADFTTVGASHVVAISGWNIAIVAATVAALAGRLGRRRRSLILAVAIIAYVLFAGASASVVRAAAMAGVVLLARESGRAGRAAAALGWAAAILLFVDPDLVRDAGFQLSTLATAGILAWADRLDRWLRSLAGGRLPSWLAESLGISLAAQAATLPVVLATFGRLAIISPAINLLIVPLVAPAMAAALLALLGGAIAVLGGPGIVATLLGLPAWGLLTAMCTIVRAGAALPIASATLAPPWTTITAIAVVIVPGSIVLVRRRGHRRGTGRAAPRQQPAAEPASSGHSAAARGHVSRLAILGLVVAVGGLTLASAHRTDGATRITVLDVGQGDAILVEGGRGARMLIDGGPDPDRLLIELDRRLPPWDRRLDVLVLTHPHEDHVAGLPILLERYRVGRVYETGMRGPGPGYGAFARDLRGPSAPPDMILRTGARIALDDIRLQVLWPDPDRVPREPPDGGRGINDVSIVLLGEVAGRRFLLTGDVEDDVDPLLAQRGLPPIDILKVAHHGSATASTPAFLDTVQPKVAIVSAGADNPYGHPARSTIERLRATGARVLRTDTDGSVAVTIEADGTIAVWTSGARVAAAARPVVGPEIAGLDPLPVPLLRGPAGEFSCGIPSGE